MRKAFAPLLAILLVAISFAASCNTPKPGMVKMKDYTDSLSYALGFIYGLDFANTDVKFNYEMIYKGLINAQNLDLEVLTEDEMMSIISRFQNDLSESFDRAAEENKQRNEVEGLEYLKNYATQSDANSTESGLHYRVVRSGSGKAVKQNSYVKVYYTGKFLSGEVFTATPREEEPITINVEEVLPGWEEGLKMMREGDIYELVLSPDLAYGDEGMEMIEPGMYLIFEIELVEVIN